MGTDMVTRLLLADGHQVVRKGLGALLRERAGFEVVGEAANGREAVERTRELAPDVVIMEVAMPGLNGAGAASQIKKELPKVNVVALSMHSDGRYVSRMLKAGASAYLLKTCDVEELLRAIRIVATGGIYLSPEVTGTVVDGYVNGTGQGAPEAPELSERETEVLQLLAEGENSKQIGFLLHVSSRTIDSHRQRIMAKLDLHTLAQLTKYAIRAGLTSVEV
jgi:DNA-binding NarL/FixJ family response regulator